MGAIRDFELDGWQAAASSYEGFAGATRLFIPSLLQAAKMRPGLQRRFDPLPSSFMAFPEYQTAVSIMNALEVPKEIVRIRT